MSNQNKAFIWYIDWLIFFVGYEYKLMLSAQMFHDRKIWYKSPGRRIKRTNLSGDIHITTLHNKNWKNDWMGIYEVEL
jgi:hypothetical protein